MAIIDSAAIVRALDLDEVNNFADINGGAPDLAIALHHRFGCTIDIVSLDANCRFIEPTGGKIEKYLARMKIAGVDKSVLQVISSRKMLGSYDTIASIDNFGSRFKIKPFKKILDGAIHNQSRLVIEIRKGSGSYPFLNDYGNCNTLSRAGEKHLGLVVMSVEPKLNLAGQWSTIAHKMTDSGGFFKDCGEHSFLHIRRGDTLVVTFDNLDIAMNKREGRKPWGFDFIEAQNWSMLGVMANGWTWFRGDTVAAEFNHLRDSGFFEQFSRVVFYGASMGGYAAAAYSAAAKGSTVFAISPQSTLDKSLVPWEARYKKAWDLDFSGPYGDAAIASQQAKKVHLMFDPYVAPDAAHAARFTGSNVTRWRCSLLGHRLGSSLDQMGILQEIARKSISGELDNSTFYQLLRKRHEFPRYQRELANLALERNRPELAARVCKFVLSQRDDAFFTNMATRIANRSE